MSMKKLVVFATTMLSGSMVLSAPALAQSTGSQVQSDEIIVTAQKRTQDGVMSAETAAKARATITQEFIETQSSGQSILATIGLIPGVSFNNNDPYGSAGGDITLRGLDAARVSLTFDGIPLNDTGNYAIFSNQTLDPEYITRANVNLGTTDVDSPTASATGGTINFVTRLPKEEFGVLTNISRGSFDFDRIVGIVDTGALPIFGTTAFIGGSFTDYNKFKGPGDIEKKQVNGRLYQALGDNGDFVSLSFHYNENRNNFYRNITLDQFRRGLTKFDNLNSCTRPVGVNGTVQNEAAALQLPNTDPLEAPVLSCTNYFNLRVNPSNTGNLRGNARFSLTDALTLTVDPSFQYVLANGGGFSTVSETDNRLQGVTDAGGRDLNGDGDTLDTIALYTPNNTNTRRYGLTSSLIWDINDEHRVRVAYTYDRGNHRQTGEAGFLQASGDPENVFGGKDGQGIRVTTADGNFLRGRDRFSVAELNQLSAEYRGKFFDDALTLTIGARAPTFKRQLNNYCYQGPQTFPANTSSTSVVCTTNLIGTGTNAITGLQAPGRAEVEYDKVLPSVGISYQLTPAQQVYFSYAEGLSAPRTDQLYAFNRAQLKTLQPETTQAFDIGYRYRGDNVLFSAGFYFNNFDNRIASARDPNDPTISLDRNIGKVEISGWDAELGFRPMENLTVYGSVAYNNAELKDNIRSGPQTAGFGRAAGPDGVQNTIDDVFLTAGKRLVETPPWTFALRTTYDIGSWTFGLQGRYTDERFFTDVNDPLGVSPAYGVVDLDARWDITEIVKGTSRTYVQLNASNIFDEKYLGNLSTSTTFSATTTHAVGAPRAVMVSLRAEF